MIRLEHIQEIRHRTGVGLKEAKDALTESQGNLEKAIEMILQSKSKNMSQSLSEMNSNDKKKALKKYSNGYETISRKGSSLFKYLIGFFIGLLIYGVFFTVLGYEKVPLGESIAKIISQLKVVILDCEADFLNTNQAKNYSLIVNKKQMLSNEPVKIGLKVKYDELYSFTLLTTLPHYPQVKIYNTEMKEIQDNQKPLNQPQHPLDKKEENSSTQKSFEVHLSAEKNYLIEIRPSVLDVELVKNSITDHYFILKIAMPNHEPNPVKIFIIIFVTGILLYFIFLIWMIKKMANSSK